MEQILHISVHLPGKSDGYKETVIHELIHEYSKKLIWKVQEDRSIQIHGK